MPMSIDSYLGEIIIHSFGIIPKGWMACEGQQLLITSNQALYAVIGTRFGGDGKTTFNLPDMRGMAVMGAGANPVLSPRQLGERTGQEAVVLNAGQVGHSHAMMSSGQVDPDKDKTVNPLSTSNLGALSIKHPGAASTAEFSYAVNASPNKTMHNETVGVTGSSIPHENRQPYLALRYCMCVAGGEFPAR